LVSFKPELFIKNVDAFFTPAISGIYPDITEKTFHGSKTIPKSLYEAF
jgi:hypothetical protein